MRVLWFEISVPYRYVNIANPRNGWQDSLENLLKKRKDIELGIAFEHIKQEKKVIDNVVYYSLCSSMNLFEKNSFSTYWQIKSKRFLPLALDVVKDFRPDIIHIFGSEWHWGDIVKQVSIPVVIHMQGSIPPYFNARLPPLYSEANCYWPCIFHFRQLIKFYKSFHFDKSRKKMEENILANVNYYMGRTDWDRKIVNLYNSRAKYYHCNEALRTDFTQNRKKWKLIDRDKIILFTIGFDFRKGADVILKTAKLLKRSGCLFEWNVAGSVNKHVLRVIEYKEKAKFADFHINLLGSQSSTEVVEHLLRCDLYVHTAYIENSPNSICEAQYMGVPIVATYVGGVPSLIKHEETGILIPSNEPHILAETIVELKKDKSARLRLSENAMRIARDRHNGDKIITDLLDCYHKVIEDYKSVMRQ